MDTIVKNKRVTLFCQTPVQFNEELANAYISEFSNKNLLPSVNKGKGVRITSQGLVLEDVVSLELKKLDDSFKVAFSSNRIDIESINAEESMEAFVATAKDIERTLSEKMNLSYVRLALFETVVFHITENQRVSAYKNIVNNEESVPVEWQLQKVRRSTISTENEPKCEVAINEVLNINCPEVDNDCVLMLDIDINTKVGATVEQIASINELFWPMANTTIAQTINDYKLKLEDVSNQ
jgi:hypothetical protein